MTIWLPFVDGRNIHRNDRLWRREEILGKRGDTVDLENILIATTCQALCSVQYRDGRWEIKCNCIGWIGSDDTTTEESRSISCIDAFRMLRPVQWMLPWTTNRRYIIIQLPSLTSMSNRNQLGSSRFPTDSPLDPVIRCFCHRNIRESNSYWIREHFHRCIQPHGLDAALSIGWWSALVFKTAFWKFGVDELMKWWRPLSVLVFQDLYSAYWNREREVLSDDRLRRSLGFSSSAWYDTFMILYQWQITD